ncbi:hypothetical protein GCM10023116_01740 [Kistimonas scapharcae]|uniref:Calcineurin-like phosphoesterase domain-containing protein n=1 Tax=Kistimonas scapharcae TaxID=1036133 RepID=A0ABP8UZE9_9GAMM
MASNILLIADTQCKPEQEWPHLAQLGRFIVDKRPDVIVHIGDHWDMPSLSAYDRGTAKAEGKRVYQDIAAGNAAMDVLLHDLHKLQAKQRRNKEKVYKPRKVFCVGNHEQRIIRHVNANPELQGFLDYSHLKLDGWEAYDFLEPVQIEGILFSHYFANPHSGKPIGGTIQNRLNKIKESFVQGHQQAFMYDKVYTLNRVLCGIVAGAFYLHDEEYMGHQGNRQHWRGICMLKDAEDGHFAVDEYRIEDIMEGRW